MYSELKQAKTQRNFLSILTISVVVVFGVLLFGGMSLERFRAAEDAWERHNLRATSINQLMLDLNRNIGYGGFIHNFKNLLLRRDVSRYQPVIEQNIADFKEDLNQLESILEVEDDRLAVAAMREVLEEYERKYPIVLKMLARGVPSNEIDSIVKVDDGPALVARARLNDRVSERATETQNQAFEKYVEAIQFLALGGIVSIFSILGLGALVLSYLKQLSRTNDQLRVSQRTIGKSMQELQFLHDTLDDHAIVSTTDVAGNIISMNQKFIEISGYSEAELLGKNHRMIKSGIHSKEFYEALWEQISAGKVWHGEVCNRAKNGSLYWVRASIRPILDESGLPIRYISIRTDITQTKEAEARATQNQILLRGVINSIPDMIFFKDKEGKYLGCNTSFERYFGATEEKIIGKTDFDFVDADTAEFFRDQDKLMLDSGEARKNEEQIVYPDGKIALINMLKLPYEYEFDKIGVIGIGHDITQSKRQLQKIQEAEARWSFAVEGAGDGVWDWNIATGEMLLSAAYEEMLGYVAGEITQTIEAWQQSVHPEDVDRISTTLAEYLAGRIDAYQIELRLRCKDGEYKWILCRGTLVAHDDAGNPSRMIGIHTDIDSRKKNELQLELLAEMVENTAQPIFLIDVQAGYRLAYVNQAACLHWKASKEELLTWRIPDWDPSFDEARTAAHFAETVGRPGVLIETTHRLKNGDVVPVEVFINARMISDKAYIFGSFQDISERKKNEESLKLFRRIFDSSEQAIGIANAQGELLYINKAHEEMHRVRQEDVLNKPFANFLAESALPLIPDIISATNQGKSWVGFLPQKRGDGTEFTSVSHIGALMGSDGKPQFLFNILYDYTDEQNRQRELETARERAELASRSKSDFLSSMSHELRTPMNAILGFAQLMEGDDACTPDQRENLQQISKAGWHLLDLINEVLDLARVETGKINLVTEAIDPAELITDCLSLTSPLIADKNISVENALATAVHFVAADYLRLKQVLINLLSNAIKYNRQGGKIQISSMVSGENLCIEVGDTGRGLSAEQIAIIFEPFTRFGEVERTQGTGIGLSICKNLMEAMNGRIDVRSVAGEGSVFTLTLPLARSDEEHVSAIGDISLLYIEDDLAQQALVKKWVSSKGWGIAFAHDAASGIDAAMNGNYDVILLDINLPGGFSGLDVKEIFDDMESLRSTPVIGVSNLVQPDEIEKAMQMGFFDYMPKPVDFKELESVIQRAMHRGV